MMDELKQKVLEANLALQKYGLVLFTWGNVSQADPGRKLIVIKPSGVKYEEMTAEQMCVLGLEGDIVGNGKLSPSTDAPTHLELYRRFPAIGGVAHTHSAYATAFAQAGRGIPCYGTTHADYFYGEIPCARPLTADEIKNDYELNTGRVIAETFERNGIDPMAVPGALVSGHGPFAWGKTAAEAAANAAYLEETARLAFFTEMLSLSANADAETVNSKRPRPVAQELMDKHYNRKHGANAYYGQKT